MCRRVKSNSSTESLMVFFKSKTQVSIYAGEVTRIQSRVSQLFKPIFWAPELRLCKSPTCRSHLRGCQIELKAPWKEVLYSALSLSLKEKEKKPKTSQQQKTGTEVGNNVILLFYFKCKRMEQKQETFLIIKHRSKGVTSVLTVLGSPEVGPSRAAESESEMQKLLAEG